MIARAKRIDSDEVVEGFYIKDRGNHYIVYESVVFFLFEDGLGYEDFEIDPTTLQYSFDGINFYSEEEIQKALEWLKPKETF